MFDLFTKGKNILASETIQQTLIEALSKYGDVKDCKLNPNKTIEIKIHLKGERANSTLKIKGYSVIFNKDESCCIQIETIETNKEWFNLIAKDFISGKVLLVKNKNACKSLKTFF